MEIRAAEISAILRQQIAGFGSEADVAEIGQVLSVGDGIERVALIGQIEQRRGITFGQAGSARRVGSQWKAVPNLCAGGRRSRQLVAVGDLGASALARGRRAPRNPRGW